MQALYAYLHSSEMSVTHAEKELHNSINKFYELYHYFFLLIEEVADYAEGRLEQRKQKYLPSADDLSPNRRFIDNKAIQQIRKNKPLHTFINNNKLSWRDHPELVRKLYNELIRWDEYNSYCDGKPLPPYEAEQTFLARNDVYTQDKNFLARWLSHKVANDELLEQTLEDRSIYWNDEIEFAISLVIKTFIAFRENTPDDKFLMPLFKNEDDREFSRRLFRRTIVSYKDYQLILRRHTANWDVDRIAATDIVLMMMAIAEMQEFETIPVKVTLNEYIELSKYYSTEKSSTFINGILDKIVEEMRGNGKIAKRGRGLVGDQADASDNDDMDQ